MKILIHTLFFFLLTTQICIAQWFPQNSGTQATLNSVDFITGDKGWVAGYNNMIKGSTNGGQSWYNYSGYTTPPSEIWYSVCFADLNDIYVCGKQYNYDRYQSNWTRSTNGGIYWTSQSAWGNDYSSSLDVFFLNKNLGWKVIIRSGKGRVYKTTSGVTGVWELKFSTDQSLTSVFFIDENNGWLVGADGKIYHSTDGGSNWTSQNSSTSKGLRSVYFTSATTGWCCGYDDNGAVIVKTTNGGQSWTSTLPVNVLKLNSIHFTDSNAGWICGSINYEQEERGVILKTLNSGESWGNQHIEDSPSILYDLDFVDSQSGWAVGTNGLLIKTTNGGVTFIDNEPTQPTDFLLSQNFPNPFNPSTKISWQAPVDGHQTIKVFDVLGNETTTLVDEYRPAGKNEVEFDASRLASGIYFYQLKAGDYVAVRKMLLIK